MVLKFWNNEKKVLLTKLIKKYSEMWSKSKQNPNARLPDLDVLVPQREHDVGEVGFPNLLCPQPVQQLLRRRVSLRLRRL